MLRTLITFLIGLTVCASAARAWDIAPGQAINAIGNPASEINTIMQLAAQYEHGEGMTQDYPKAIELYCKAARLGSAEAQYALGWMYANARGVARDDSIAAHFFSLAAAQNHPQALAMTRYMSGDTSIKSPCPIAPAQTSISADTQETAIIEATYPKGPIFHLVQKLAPQYGLDPQLVLAIISVESGFNTQAKSPKNAQGLMQLTPDTAQRFKVKDPFNPEDNLKGGMAYLQWLLSLFQGNIRLVAAAYNAGERAVENHRGIPPYWETQNYVIKITNLYRKAAHPFKENVMRASPLMKEVSANQLKHRYRD